VRHAVAFEFALLVVAVGVGWLVSVNPFARFDVTVEGLLIGVAGTVPPTIGLWLLHQSDSERIRRFIELIHEVVGPTFRRATMLEVVALALMAGLAEEALFRGLVQEGLSGIVGALPALLLSGVLFGLVHWVTPLYAFLATLIGLYLGGLYLVTGNLLVPIVVHALYDVVALRYLMNDGFAAKTTTKG
jgi:hypothetical protein